MVAEAAGEVRVSNPFIMKTVKPTQYKEYSPVLADKRKMLDLKSLETPNRSASPQGKAPKGKPAEIAI